MRELLEAFLKKKGLLEIVNKYTKENFKETNNPNCRPSSLLECFVFIETKEGHEYWSKISKEFYEEVL